MMDSKIILGDCLKVMPTLDADSIDSIVCDPPYGLEFMGKAWDHGVPGVEFWIEALRVAKPGAYLLAFGGTRMYHRLAVAIEDAGWEIRDSISWLYGSGFPKSLDVSRALDKAAGAEREVVGESATRLQLEDHDDIYGGWKGKARTEGGGVPITAPATDAARQWNGWGTALKPAWEPIIVARKPLIGTVAANVLKHGTGGINIDACRIEGTPRTTHADGNRQGTAPHPMSWGEPTMHAVQGAAGRWPANVILDEEAAALLDEQTGTLTSGKGSVMKASAKGGARSNSIGAESRPEGYKMLSYADTGGASRFFYTAKASRSERTHGGTVENKHPTVKPISLMRYLVRLVTPPGGSVLDPFCGSGSTLVAAVEEDRDFVGIEQDAESYRTACERVLASGTDVVE